MSIIDPLAPVGDTSVRIGDLTLIGEAVLNLASTTHLLRHARPVDSLVYIDPLPVLHQQVVTDFAAWCGYDKDAGAERRDRLLAFLSESGWQARMMSGLTA